MQPCLFYFVMKPYARHFYLSPQWRRCRDAYYKKQNGICERCGNAADIVHHKIYISPSNINNPKITLNFDNLELLCQDCHNKEHKKNCNTRYSIDEEGNVLPPTI
jgi:5-methylcytosine-specific restriction endonuclease McrA